MSVSYELFSIYRSIATPILDRVTLDDLRSPSSSSRDIEIREIHFMLDEDLPDIISVPPSAPLILWCSILNPGNLLVLAHPNRVVLEMNAGVWECALVTLQYGETCLLRPADLGYTG